jgi:hypothetical protein
LAFGHVNNMPKANQEPDPNRRQTRPTNANAHPGKVVLEALAVRRKREDIEAENNAWDGRCQSRESKKANERAAVVDIANFENQMACDDRTEVTVFPRHQTMRRCSVSRLENVLLTYTHLGL